MEKFFSQSIYYFISLWQQAKMRYVCNSFLWHIHAWVSSYTSDYCFSKYLSVYPSSFFPLIPIPGQSLQHFNTMNMLMIFRNDLQLRSLSWAPSSYHQHLVNISTEFPTKIITSQMNSISSPKSYPEWFPRSDTIHSTTYPATLASLGLGSPNFLLNSIDNQILSTLSPLCIMHLSFYSYSIWNYPYSDQDHILHRLL